MSITSLKDVLKCVMEESGSQLVADTELFHIIFEELGQG